MWYSTVDVSNIGVFTFDVDLKSSIREVRSKPDTDDALISEAHYSSIIKFGDNLKSEFKATLLKIFLNGREEDGHENLTCNLKKPSGNQHKTKQNYSHCLVRRQEVVLSKVDQIKEATQLLKEKSVTNLVDNIADQSQTGTVVE